MPRLAPLQPQAVVETTPGVAASLGRVILACRESRFAHLGEIPSNARSDERRREDRICRSPLKAERSPAPSHVRVYGLREKGGGRRNINWRGESATSCPRRHRVLAKNGTRFAVFVAIALTAFGATAVSGRLLVPSAHARSLSCVAKAYGPTYLEPQRTGYAVGQTQGCATNQGWAYNLWLYTKSGTQLMESSGGGVGNEVEEGTSVSCAGDYIHSTFYINAGGAGSSDTSGDVGPC